MITLFISIQKEFVRDFGLGGGVLWNSSDGDDRRMFLGLKFSIPEFVWVGQFGEYFLGGLVFWGNFLGYSKQSEDS